MKTFLSLLLSSVASVAAFGMPVAHAAAYDCAAFKLSAEGATQLGSSIQVDTLITDFQNIALNEKGDRATCSGVQNKDGSSAGVICGLVEGPSQVKLEYTHSRSTLVPKFILTSKKANGSGTFQPMPFASASDDAKSLALLLPAADGSALYAVGCVKQTTSTSPHH